MGRTGRWETCRSDSGFHAILVNNSARKSTARHSQDHGNKTAEGSPAKACVATAR